MNLRRAAWLPLSCLLLSACAAAGQTADKVAVGSLPSWEASATANYMLNYKKSSFEEDSFSGLSNDLLYQQETITLPAKLTPPEHNPVRSGYDFTGWYHETAATTLWDFANETATESVFLYAGWSRTGEASYVEPSYTPPLAIDDTLEKNLEITGVLNCSLSYGTAYLTAGGMKRLANSPLDVRFALNWKQKTGTEITGAVYDAASGEITVTSTFAGATETATVKVALTSTDLSLTNPTYEAKASAYEAADADAENYHIMLAGSSSIEFWTNYEHDLAPIKAYSHGIGGTVSTEWNSVLLDRLVVPYCPKAIVYYVGVNDLVNSSDSDTTIISHVETLFESTHSRLPNAHIFYVLINKLPGYYLGYESRIVTIGEALQSYMQGKDWIEAIDAGSVLLKTNGHADAAYFRLDNLHLSEYGYVLWAAEIKKALKAWLG